MSRTVFAAILMPLLGTLAADVAGKQDEPLDDSTVISLTRTVCFGSCPEYDLRIFGSGKVEYEGRHYVCAFGPHTATVDPRLVRRLVDAMVAREFFGLEWKQGRTWTDQPTVTSALQYGGRSYSVEHYHGDEGAPRWLREMEDEIDQVAGTARWLPATDENGSRSLCADPAGSLRDVSIVEREHNLGLRDQRITVEPPTTSLEEPTHD
jgi:Domain of unknown function (DUF6438)